MKIGFEAMATNGKAKTAAAKTGEPTCFVVCPIGSELSPQRKHSDQALRHIIKPVLEAAGFQEPSRADKLSESGNITRQIINHIREDDLVIADLTGHNPNVFYELAIRHCTGLPFIQMIRKGEDIPFDLGPMRTISFDLSDPDDVVSTREVLARQVASAMTEGAQVDTPVGAAMDFEKLASTGGMLERLLSTLIERVDGLEQGNRPAHGRNLERYLWNDGFLEETVSEAGFVLSPSERLTVLKVVLEQVNVSPLGISPKELKALIVRMCRKLAPEFEAERYAENRQFDQVKHKSRTRRA